MVPITLKDITNERQNRSKAGKVDFIHSDEEILKAACKLRILGLDKYVNDNISSSVDAANGAIATLELFKKDESNKAKYMNHLIMLLQSC